MPSELHEMINRLLALMATALTDELGMKIKGYGCGYDIGRIP
ncbi:MAG: hypothetical protein ACFE0I_15895 [Elainellaceae cyanobacterium]